MQTSSINEYIESFVMLFKFCCDADLFSVVMLLLLNLYINTAWFICLCSISHFGWWPQGGTMYCICGLAKNWLLALAGNKVVLKTFSQWMYESWGNPFKPASDHFRSMSTWGVSCARSMRMTASLTSLNAAGMAVTGKCISWCSILFGNNDMIFNTKLDF